MSSERIKAEEFWNPEHIVEKFWKGLENGVIYARKCKECGEIESPSAYRMQQLRISRDRMDDSQRSCTIEELCIYGRS